MASSTTTGASILTPEQVTELIVRPFSQASVATRVGTVVPIDSHNLRVPVVSADPSAAWTAEGAEIAVSDPTLTEVNITPAKLAGLTVVSSELAADSSPAALQVVGDGIVRDLATKTDQAFFASVTTNGPAGLLSIAATAVDAGDTWANFDFVEAAKSTAEQHNTVVDTFVCNPATAVKLATLKEYSTAGSNKALLQADPTAAASRVLGGVPLLTSPSIANDIVWAIPRNRVIVALRTGTQVVTDTSAYFTSDRVGVRATLRISWGFTDPAAISKIAITP
jgi:HK97 family phage major capsid protein